MSSSFSNKCWEMIWLMEHRGQTGSSLSNRSPAHILFWSVSPNLRWYEKKKKKTQHISAVRSVSEPGLPRESHVTETKLVLNLKWFKIEQHWWFFFLFLFTTGSPFSQSLTKVCSEVGLIFLLPGCIPLSHLVYSAPDGNVRRLMMWTHRELRGPQHRLWN